MKFPKCSRGAGELAFVSLWWQVQECRGGRGVSATHGRPVETCSKENGGFWKQAVAPALLELEDWRETQEGEKNGAPLPTSHLPLGIV